MLWVVSFIIIFKCFNSGGENSKYVKKGGKNGERLEREEREKKKKKGGNGDDIPDEALTSKVLISGILKPKAARAQKQAGVSFLYICPFFIF